MRWEGVLVCVYEVNVCGGGDECVGSGCVGEDECKCGCVCVWRGCLLEGRGVCVGGGGA